MESFEEYLNNLYLELLHEKMQLENDLEETEENLYYSKEALSIVESAIRDLIVDHEQLPTLQLLRELKKEIKDKENEQGTSHQQE